MLPPQPLPEVPQGAPEPAPEPAEDAAGRFPVCFLPLFCLGCCDFCWSCGLLFRSNVCAQPVEARHSEQNSARHARFFFTGPPFLISAERTHGTRFSAALFGFSENCPQTGQQLCSHHVPDAIFGLRGFFSSESSEKSPKVRIRIPLRKTLKALPESKRTAGAELLLFRHSH
jgi:hypothetical protein